MRDCVTRKSVCRTKTFRGRIIKAGFKTSRCRLAELEGKVSCVPNQNVMKAKRDMEFSLHSSSRIWKEVTDQHHFT
jgi:hypothetical protein